MGLAVRESTVEAPGHLPYLAQPCMTGLCNLLVVSRHTQGASKCCTSRWLAVVLLGIVHLFGEAVAHVANLHSGRKSKNLVIGRNYIKTEEKEKKEKEKWT